MLGFVLSFVTISWALTMPNTNYGFTDFTQSTNDSVRLVILSPLQDDENQGLGKETDLPKVTQMNDRTKFKPWESASKVYALNHFKIVNSFENDLVTCIKSGKHFFFQLKSYKL